MYTALKETEQRATDVLPLWKLQFLHPLIPRQRKASEAVALIRQTTEQLIAKCREMVDAEEQVCQALVVTFLSHEARGADRNCERWRQCNGPCVLCGTEPVFPPSADWV